VSAGTSHGGTGGTAQTLSGLDKDPVVSVELCEVTVDGRVHAGRVKLTTASGRTLAGGEGSQNCKTIAPPHHHLLGFYGRAGSEVDTLGTIWAEK
jgi:hypothetical protein